MRHLWPISSSRWKKTAVHLDIWHTRWCREGKTQQKTDGWTRKGPDSFCKSLLKCCADLMLVSPEVKTVWLALEPRGLQTRDVSTCLRDMPRQDSWWSLVEGFIFLFRKVQEKVHGDMVVVRPCSHASSFLRGKISLCCRSHEWVRRNCAAWASFFPSDIWWTIPFSYAAATVCLYFWISFLISLALSFSQPPNKLREIQLVAKQTNKQTNLLVLPF